MGSSASKSTRKLPTSVPSQPRPIPKWAGARTPHPDPLVPEGAEMPGAASSSPSSSSSSSSRPAFDYGQFGGSSRSSTSAPGQMDARGRSRGEFGMADTGAEPGSTGKARAGFSGEKDDAVLRDGRDPQFMSNLSRLGQVKIHDAGKFMNTPAPAQRTLNARDPSLTTPTQLPPSGHLTAPLLSSLLDKLKTLPAGSDPGRVYKEYSMNASTMSAIRRWVNSPSVGEDEVRVEEGERIVEMKAVWVDAADLARAAPRRIEAGGR